LHPHTQTHTNTNLRTTACVFVGQLHNTRHVLHKKVKQAEKQGLTFFGELAFSNFVDTTGTKD